MQKNEEIPLKRTLAMVLIGLILLSSGTTVVFAEDKSNTENKLNTVSSGVSDVNNYYAYYNAYKNIEKVNSSVTIGDSNITGIANMTTQTYNDKSGIELSEDNDWCEWLFEVPESGLYSIKLNYYPVAATGLDIEVGLKIDNSYPFSDCGDITLPRIWADEGPIKSDSVGNDIRPAQVEKPHWNDKWLENSDGMYEEPYMFYLEAGKHTLRLQLLREAFVISSITFANKQQPISYDEYIKQYDVQKTTGETYVLQAESAYEKSSSMLYPIYDRGNIATYPSDAVYTRYNTIGGSNWDSYGSAISWKAEVPEDGLYKIQIRVRQNFNPGLKSYRNLYINGELPLPRQSTLDSNIKQVGMLKHLAMKNRSLFISEKVTL